MIQENAFTPVLDALNALEIPYMIVGSYASNYWGRPRMLGTMFERKVWLTSAEDIILSKLLWYKMSPVLDRQLQWDCLVDDGVNTTVVNKPKLLERIG